MLVDESQCDQSSHSETYNAGRQTTQQSHVEDDTERSENDSVREQANLPSLSPEDSTDQGLTDKADVGVVVGKAKKAAHFLWLLIHAQNCNFGGDRCPHKGCTDAKRVLLHIKTCPAELSGQICPSNYSGCHQARKLLIHHSKCREIRAKKAGMGRRQNKEQYACLICSLVARQAKTMLEVPSRKASAKKQVIASFTIAKDQEMDCQHTGSQAMPPPPPRQRPSSNRCSPNSDSSTEDMLSSGHTTHFGAPPATATVSTSTTSSEANKTPFLEFAATALQNLRRASPNEADNTEMHMAQCRSLRRIRAESYDERALTRKQGYASKFLDPMRQLDLEGGDKIRTEIDPTLELDLKGEENVEGESIVRRVPLSRRRSASLSILASACEGHVSTSCDRIVEESTDAQYVPVHQKGH